MQPKITYRHGMIRVFMLALTIASVLFLGPVTALWAAEPIVMGSRVEPFVDRYLIDRTEGDVDLHLHKPVAKEVVLTTDLPWEGNTSAYYTIFQDGPLYRMYYRGSHFDTATKKSGHPEVTCYAQSTDGIHWTKPKLGLVEFEGSKENNIIWDGVGTHNFTPFLDTNPNCKPDAKYKALGRGHRGYPKGLYAMKSADGLRWSLMSQRPVITEGAFDSQNLAFWDESRSRYVEFHRGFRERVRDIMTCNSNDFSEWTKPVWIEYPDAPKEHLYTNAIRPYPRASGLFIGFPTRYHPERGSQVEPTLMTSRDGLTFHRWTEALIPVTAPEDRDGNRSNYMGWGLLELPDREAEYSVYATEAYYTDSDSRVRRFTYRVDGFVSLRASADGGQVVTRPLVFDGKQLRVNVATSATGSIRVEIQDANGVPVPGFTLADSLEITGDQIEALVAWQQGSELGPLAGKPVRLRFEMHDADLYSIRFR